MANIITWEGVMKGALSMPFVKVNRRDFLIKTFFPYGNVDQLQYKRPNEVYPKSVLDKVAKGVIQNHLNKVSLISAAAGIPGGLTMLGTVPADLAQYYWHFLVMSQKLAYVYGWPDLTDDNNNLGEEAQAILTVFVGLGFGVQAAENAVEAIARQAAAHYAKKLPQMALTKTAWYPIVKKVAAWLGVKLTKDTVGKAAGKIIPVFGAVFSGSITYLSFKPMAKRLCNSLSDTSNQFLPEPINNLKRDEPEPEIEYRR